MTVALLISTYNWPEALNLVLQSALHQTVLPNEILIADDGSTAETKALIASFQAQSAIPIKHIWHEDKGFRRAMILNKAPAQSECDYIIQVDGDCILHRKFVEDHISKAKANVFLYGARAHIKEESVETIIEKELLQFHFLSSMFIKRGSNLRIPLLAKRYKESDVFPGAIRGCNLSFWRQDFIAINGYDENFEGWGHEDLDIVARMMNNGVSALKIRHIAIQFHLYHNEVSRDREAANKKLYDSITQNKTIHCSDGIDKYLSMNNKTK